MFDFFASLIFGIVEGITEWLPVSSTGHLILVEQFLKFKNVTNLEAFSEMFDVIIQLGAIFAVVVLYFKQIWPFTTNKSKGFKNVPFLDKGITVLWFKILTACIPAAVLGLIFDDLIDKYLYNHIVVAAMLIIFGIWFIVIENKKRVPKVETTDSLTYRDAVIIGLFQLIAAIFPGTSRSGATIIGALLIGISRPAAAEFTFYLAIPVMFGASLLKLVKYILEFGLYFTTAEIMIILVGMLSAFIVSVVVIKFLMSYIKKHDFKVFGWYRIVLGIAVLLFSLIS